MKSLIDKFQKFFSEERWQQAIVKEVNRYGSQLMYAALLLYYAYRRSDTPSWAKNIIIGALGYLLSPFDVIPDLSPFIGYTDDISVLIFAITTIACYIDSNVKAKALARLKSVIKNPEKSAIQEIDKML